ncbi:hypothetical protein FQN60_002551 [Etheostoma spectabile]|uniref:Uncharacterized protein n=1 Tax=Etheostoma spectabile TaxID=54343 RepID=A0A5J5CBR3_9PERO|nr:hypothetical protein FQN60_002551 [Etheostoma spectabile]
MNSTPAPSHPHCCTSQFTHFSHSIFRYAHCNHYTALFHNTTHKKHLFVFQAEGS